MSKAGVSGAKSIGCCDFTPRDTPQILHCFRRNGQALKSLLGNRVFKRSLIVDDF
jgi:hypothetical protein